ncbi:MAG: PP2C family protein-serine/threonine phosphatase, partial [Actinomycetota bacterium]
LGKNKIAIAVGDVCGKGLEAATYTAMIKYMLRAYLEEGLYPGDCLTRLNHSVHKEVSIDKFITVGLALIDTTKYTITYASAGHPPPIICQENSANPLHIPHGIPLGVLANRKFLSSQIAPIGACSIVMYTDGLIEARPDGGVPMGQDRLCDTLSQLCDLSAKQLVNKLLETALKYSGGSLKDDIAILAVRLPANPESGR